MATDEKDEEEGTASDGMQVDKKEKEKSASHAQPSGVTDCCICE